jgi:outer membrane protein TolC
MWWTSKPLVPRAAAILLALVAPITISSALPALATPPLLDLGAIASRAREVSHAVTMSRAAVDVARVEGRRNLQRLNPQLGLSGRYTRISEESPIVIEPGIPGVSVSLPGPRPDQWAFGFSVTFPLSDWLVRKAAIEDASGASVNAQAALRVAAERRASLEAMLAYFALVRVVRAEVVARQSLLDAERRTGEVRLRIEARLGSEADLRLAEVDLAARREDLDVLGNSRQLLLAQLGTLLDLEDSSFDSFSLELAAVEVGPLLGAPVSAMLAEASRLRPEVKALGEGRLALSARADLARAARLPRLDLAANAQLVDPNPRTLMQEDGLVGIWDVSAVLSWQLDGLWQADTDLRGLAAERTALEADQRALEDGFRMEIEAALTALRDAESRRLASNAMIAAASEGHRVRLALYRAGSATATEVAEAETQLARARLAAVDAEVGLWVGKVRLDHALGRPL